MSETPCHIVKPSGQTEEDVNLAKEMARRDRELKERELALTAERAKNDRELKEQEIAVSRAQQRQDRKFKLQELRLKRRELAAGRWAGPVAIAVVGGLLGIVGTLFSARENRELERKKQEGTLVLEAIRTGSAGKQREQQAAANLVFLADAGLVNLGKDQLASLRQKAGDATPSLPSTGSVVSTGVPEPIRQRILKSFDEFAKYFQNNGASTPPKVGVDTVPPNVPGVIAYYDFDKSTVYIDAQYLTDINFPLREYAHAVLYADGKFSAIDYERTWVYVGIESGLASYFSSSYRDDPHVPGGDNKGTLDNSRNLKDMRPGPSVTMDGLYIWGGAFWNLRRTLGKDLCDKLLYAAWQNLKEAEFKKNDPKDFVNSVVAADVVIGRSQHAGQIRDVFRRRGAEL